jgi:hypothetical protein
MNCGRRLLRWLGRKAINRTSTELRVEWNHLKRRMSEARPTLRKPVPPAFVELVAPRPQSFPECTLELEGPYCKLRIQLKNAPASYLAKLSRELLESAS